MIHPLPVAGALALAAALLLGCGESERPGPAPEQPDRPSSQAQADPDPTDPQETVIGDPGTLPDDFPQELLPPGSQSTVWSAWSGAGQLVSFTSDQDPQALFDHFMSELGSSGWEVGSSDIVEEDEEKSWQLSATKGAQLARISITKGAEAPSEFAVAITRKK